MTDYVLHALPNVFTISNLLYANLGLFFGIVIGALPGLTATMGVVLMLPLTFAMDRPFTRSLLHSETMIVRPNRQRENMSGAPNFSAYFAMVGAKNSRQAALTTPPAKEATNAISRALPALPWRARGLPSHAVAAEAGVPGVFSRMAVMLPP